MKRLHINYYAKEIELSKNIKRNRNDDSTSIYDKAEREITVCAVREGNKRLSLIQIR